MYSPSRCPDGGSTINSVITIAVCRVGLFAALRLPGTEA
jgi:hypothetical protein